MSKVLAIRIRHKADRVLDRFLSGKSMGYQQIITIILPLMVDQAFITLMGLLNTAMISSSGAEAVAAVNMIDSINLFLLNVFVAISTGGTVVVAQYKGIGNDNAVSKAAAQAVSMVAIVSLFIGATVAIGHNPLINLLFGRAEQGVLDNARVYLIGSCLTYPFFAVIEAVCGALRGIGETKSSLLLTIITNGTYMLLNVFFINILKLGVIGLVTSLLTARVIGMICSLVYIMKIHKTLSFHWKDILHCDFSLMRKILFIGVPFAAEQMFFNGGKLLTQTYIVGLGTNAQFVNAVASSISNVFQIGANACNLGIVTVVGQCIGRRDIVDARKFERSFLLLGSIFMIVTELLLLPFITPLIQFFNPPPEIVSTIKFILLFVGVAYPIIWPSSFITPSALRAAGDSRFTSVASLLTMWLVRVVLGYILGVLLPFGIAGVWAAMVIEWFVRGSIFHIRLRGDKWYRHQLVEKE